MSKNKRWECSECGAIVRHAKPPHRCPKCGAPREDFAPLEQEEEADNSVDCPKCHEPLDLSDGVRLGKRIRCQGCDATLEVVELDPPVLKLVAGATRPGRARWHEDRDF